MDFITKVIYVSVISLALSFPLHGNEQEDLYIRFENTLSLHTNQVFHDFSWVTPQIRSELIEYADTKTGLSSTADFVPPKEVLLWLGDSSTIEDAIDAYRKADGSQNIWEPPEILPYLIDDLSNASSDNHTPLGCSLMDQSVKSAFSIIATWLAFPKTTRDWAQRAGFNFPLHGIGTDAPENSLLREWWKHNQSAIAARQYDKATWLPPAGNDTVESPAHPTTTSPSVSSPSSSAQVQALSRVGQVQASDRLSIPLWVYGIIVLSVGFLAGLMHFLMTRNKNGDRSRGK